MLTRNWYKSQHLHPLVELAVWSQQLLVARIISVKEKVKVKAIILVTLMEVISVLVHVIQELVEDTILTVAEVLWFQILLLWGVNKLLHQLRYTRDLQIIDLQDLAKIMDPFQEEIPSRRMINGCAILTRSSIPKNHLTIHLILVDAS